MEKNPLLEAISFAARKHQGHFRKDDKTPYAAHPFRVAVLLMSDFGVKDPEVLAAAVLHDTIEDTTTDRDEIAEHFGPRVAEYVALLSKDKRLVEAEREERYLEQLAGAPLEVKLCKLADTLDNLIDCGALEGAKRKRFTEKAEELLRLFAPGFPPEWAHALERVREELRAREAPAEP